MTNQGKKMMGTIVVTGGMGFIGSHFIRHQLSTYPDVQVINVDKLTYAGNSDNLRDLQDHPRYCFRRGDVCDRDLIDSLLGPPGAVDAVVNFAAESHVDRSIDNASLFVKTNVTGTQVLMDACRALEIPRFLQVSTDEVYGSLGRQGYFTEESPLCPSSPYAASKAAADLLIRSYCHTYGFPAIITRCTNNYGPCQFPEKLIPLLISNAINGEPLPIYGTGTNVREWIHVLDHCSGIDAALRRGRVGETYNLGSGVELRNLDIARMILQILGKPESLIRLVEDRPGHDLRYAVDCRKAGTQLGWRPCMEFQRGLRETINWYRHRRERLDGGKIAVDPSPLR